MPSSVCASPHLSHAHLWFWLFDLLGRKESAQFHSLLPHLPRTPFPPIPNPHNFLSPPRSCQHSLLCHLLIPSGDGFDECGISAKAALQGPLQQSLSELLTQCTRLAEMCCVEGKSFYRSTPQCKHLYLCRTGKLRLLYFHRNCMETVLDSATECK